MRIIRTCKEMGIKTAALCPKPGEEQNFLETTMANEYYFLDREGSQGYLDQRRLIEIAKKARADAIHPGYGFLAENWRFAKTCRKNNIIFIGPHFNTLRRLEDKIEAKRFAQKVGIPVLPGSGGSIKTKGDLFKWVMRIRPPFVLKARRGGGGIGIRAINGQISFGEIFSTSLGIKRQMSMAFSDTDYFLEKCLTEAKHIEFQILGDGEKFLHLGERECTIQRRFQKLLEEAPSTFLDAKKREELGNLAVKLARELRYQGAGTIEFLMDPDQNFYFIEINPRIQVEHSVTEAITGIDLVEQQIRIARGERIKLSQADISFSGWAIEARINAEDPQKNFQPLPGKILKYLPPGGQGVFLHTFLHEGQEVYPYFDSLLAKLISVGKTREEAISKLKRALDEFLIDGVPTTIPFFKVLLQNKDFLEGNFTTDFVEKSGILRELKPQVPKKEAAKAEENPPTGGEEKEIAEIIFHIYQSLKKPEEQVFISEKFRNKETPSEREFSSNWAMSERLKMLE